MTAKIRQKGKARQADKQTKKIDLNRPPKAQHLDCMHRLNFLYQAAHLYTSQQRTPIASPYTPSIAGIGRMFGHQMKHVAKKLVVRLDPHVKRTICKKCHGALVPGISSTVRLDDTSAKKVDITCLYCENVRTLGINTNYTLFNDKNEWVGDTLEVAL
ncbi:hypothetical protein QVD99_008090 [Batrachochytrium dendrobatidis]|nr:hypothetical protein O5D80_004757 [Batrachochytrium dendrobatidis]KAK5665244.1 hypothetical protein QVD99_008090 [Batrachochytrium dendrobatidis]